MASEKEPNSEVVAKRPSSLILFVLSETAIYGVMLVSALVIVTSQRSETTWDALLKVLVSVLVFWVAHVFATVVSHLGVAVNGDKSCGALIRYGMRHSSGLLVAALVPLIVLLLGGLGVISNDTAVWTALWVDVVLLGGLGYLAVARVTRVSWARFVGAGTTALLGVAIMVLKALIH